ncbi:MAG: PDZ domain-containing protein [Candidatus Omnitrophota bacterium]
MKKILLAVIFLCVAAACRADTVYLKNGSTTKGLVVEEYYDRYVFSTELGEADMMKSDIEEVFFDELYQNNLYLGNKFRDAGDFEKAFLFYQSALRSYENYTPAEDSIKGLEDAKWRFGRNLRYVRLRALLKEQLGIELGKKGKHVFLSNISRAPAEKNKLLLGDRLINCWQSPLVYAGLKNAAKFLVGPPNTIVKLTVERDLAISPRGMGLLKPIAVLSGRHTTGLALDMAMDGLVVKNIDKESAASASGLKKGDLIMKIDGSRTRYMTLGEARRLIYGSAKKITLTIRREVIVMRKRSNPGTGNNAMWVWHTKEVLLEDDRRQDLFDFCRDKGIGVLFFQLQYEFIEENGEVACNLRYKPQLREFLKEAHRHNIKVHALDGAPGFVLEKEHRFVLAQLSSILEYNMSVIPQERFDGAHYDNEPYLLPEFNTDRKEDILRQFLLLNQKCILLIEESGHRIAFGVDVPFWFAEFDEQGKAVCAVEFNGEEKAVSFHLLDICTNIGVMDYRNFADGPDGVIALAKDELKYASGTDKKVFIGLETSSYESNACFVSRLDAAEYSRIAAEHGLSGAPSQLRFEGQPLKVYVKDGKAYVGLSGTKEDPVKKDALKKLGGMFGFIYKPEAAGENSSFVFDVEHPLSQNPEFRDIDTREMDAGDGRKALIVTLKEIIMEKLTFAHLSEADLNAVLAESQKEFANYPGFAGFAIHYYKSYKALAEKE